jgi:hypothetical protein
LDEVVGKVERFEKHYTASPVIEIDGMFFVVVLMDALIFFKKCLCLVRWERRRRGRRREPKPNSWPTSPPNQTLRTN